MKTPSKDTNKTAARQVAKVTKTSLPKGEDLLGSPELKRQLAQAKAKGKNSTRTGFSNLS